MRHCGGTRATLTAQESLRIRAVPAVAYHAFADPAVADAAAAAARRILRATAGCSVGDFYASKSEGLVVAAAAAQAEISAEIRRL